jgi:hypothetical protein
LTGSGELLFPPGLGRLPCRIEAGEQVQRDYDAGAVRVAQRERLDFRPEAFEFGVDRVTRGELAQDGRDG